MEMRKKDQYKPLVLFLISLVHIIWLTAVFSYVWYNHYVETMENPFFRRGNYVVVALYMLMVYMFNRMSGNFKVGYVRPFEALYSHLSMILSVNVVTYLQICLIGRWAFLEQVKPIVFITLVDLVLEIAWVFLTRYIFVKIYSPRELLLIYGQYSPDMLIDKLSSRKDKYNVKETISIDVDFDIIKNKIDKFDGVILADIPSQIRNRYLKVCFEKNVRCYSVPKISDILIMNSSNIHLFDTALLLFRNSGMTIAQIFWKRFFDVIFSVLGILISGPIMIIIAILIKLEDGGPVFFTQERLTRDKKIFNIIKFRSMKILPATETVCMTQKGDPRITRVGSVIRSLHLDELPQLFNILIGDMSLVGPRPECPSIAEKYSQFLPEFDFRLKVKAGLTGYAQVYGQYNTTPYDKLKLDLQYIKKYSLMLDFKLILLTAKIFFLKEKSEGIDRGQTTAATKANLEQVEKNAR